MNNIIAENLTRNGNGVDAINGRGTLRRKLTPRQRIALGADIALGVTPLAPSLKQSAAAVGISVFELRKELKAREAEAERERHAEYSRQGALPIVSAWDHATAQGRAEAIRLIGVANVWDVLAHVVG
jgi:hypothetical protein